MRVGSRSVSTYPIVAAIYHRSTLGASQAVTNGRARVCSPSLPFPGKVKDGWHAGSSRSVPAPLLAMLRSQTR
jgi:hypothetical protein